MNKSDSITELAVALSKFQGNVTNPLNTANNPFFKSKYAPLNDVLNLVRPLLSEQGLSVVQAPSGDGENIIIITTLLHESGQWITFPALVLKADKATAQGAGSAITYARRYALSAILGIASEDDDDGNHAETTSGHTKSDSGPSTKPLSDAQITRLYTIAKSVGVDQTKVDSQVQTQLKKEVSLLTKKEYDMVCKGYEAMKK